MPVKKTTKLAEASLEQKVAFELSSESLFEVSIQDTLVIAKKVIAEGADSVKGFDWFLTPIDREEIAAAIKKKFGLK